MERFGDINMDIDDEEDVFYDELRKQILLLTADDDEDDYLKSARQTSKRSTVVATQPAGGYFYCWGTQNGNFTPPWLVNLWGNSKGGTGVFIPRIKVISRKQRSGKKNRWSRRTYKQVDATTKLEHIGQR